MLRYSICIGRGLEKMPIGSKSWLPTGIKSCLPTGINVVRVDYIDEQSLSNTLQGQEFSFISLAVTAPPAMQDKVIQAAGKACMPYIMLNGCRGGP